MAPRTSLVLTLLVSLAAADIYLHNPRGSNNRLDEDTRDRRNANRMFDSQNNNRGGYNVGNVYYYGTSKLQIEWTNQHSCGNPNANCELVLQYMCGDQIRDGAHTGTIPEDMNHCYNNNCDTDLRYGMNEGAVYYKECKARARNRGLFTADQDLNDRHRTRARNTRQNPAGTRRGYECPEERDYYPYWHPSPWIDIAVMTNDASRCAYYQTHSQNVKSSHACTVPVWFLSAHPNTPIPNNEIECNEFARRHELEDVTWEMFEPNGAPAPDCKTAAYSRDNHLGNGMGGFPNTYEWTIPNIDQESCVLRIRYNISTNDYDGWNTYAESNADQENRGAGTKINLQPKYSSFASEDAARAAGYIFKNDPTVQIFPNADFRLRLAINTAQFSRTFQDRSHRFSIKRRPDEVPEEAEIINLNVRGKRGNIVETYPAVEYDFVPNDLTVKQGDMVHIQWTGSNSNNHGNDGEGRQQTDRNNIVMLDHRRFPEGSNSAYMGCYKDHKYQRLFRWVVRRSSMTVPYCRQLCRDRDYNFAGLENSAECWCGKADTVLDYRFALAPDAECNSPCAGDNSTMCGGPLRLSVHIARGFTDRSAYLGHLGQYGLNFPMHVDTTTFLGFSPDDIKDLAFAGHLSGEQSLLDDGGTYYDLGLRMAGGKAAVYHYMCTRNNNFSNRDQKARITVLPRSE